MNPIRIGERLIGGGQPCFLVAEIGINHNGDIELAKKTIDAAVDAGADAVKFQNYRTEDFISDKSLTYEYISQGKTVIETQYEMFKRYELTMESLGELKAYCDRRLISFHSTPTSEGGIRDLVEIGAPVLKNGSDYLTHLPLIRQMGQTGLPTVLSTGMATLAEIDDALHTFYETGNNQLILLHCTSSYPTPPEDVHLRKIPALSAVFGCLVGFSDHTEGISGAVGAVTLGACWIEKHFTLDKNLPGPDHWFSSDPDEFRNLVTAVRKTEKCLGNSSVGPTPSETQGRQNFRLSCVAAHSLPAGHLLTQNDIVFQRPGTGIPPAHSYLLVGRTLKYALLANKVIELSNLN
ncbi:MAG: N-acetylneuraminate synthase family protein [Nostoc sp.]|uniref:N-acetylneuraminate synthase family protein n=1 Tax=unclassified Nostoc TaxID=2593658 RepID=UPI001DF1E28F|nr:N-acetylneuraminate synthase family protein [Nostoc sp. JL34]MBN3881466.1 N-acetylneuraminate synthase family protein [Nostoc sp. JL34]